MYFIISNKTVCTSKFKGRRRCSTERFRLMMYRGGNMLWILCESVGFPRSEMAPYIVFASWGHVSRAFQPTMSLKTKLCATLVKRDKSDEGIGTSKSDRSRSRSWDSSLRLRLLHLYPSQSTHLSMANLMAQRERERETQMGSRGPESSTSIALARVSPRLDGSRAPAAVEAASMIWVLSSLPWS